jgi:hypothetical protein
LLRKLSGTPWVAGNSLVFTHRFLPRPTVFYDDLVAASPRCVLLRLFQVLVFS